MRGRLQVTGRSATGDAFMSFAVLDVHTLDDVVDPAARTYVDRQARQLKDAHATWRLQPDGTLDDIQIDLPNAPPSTRDHITTLSDAASELFVHFPDADIGVGAVWQVESRSTLSGVTWTQRSTYTLRELTGGQATVDVSIALRASSQRLGVEPNATTTLTSATGTIHGQAFVPRHGLVVSGTSEITTEANYRIVRGHLRITSTIRSESSSSRKRVD